MSTPIKPSKSGKMLDAETWDALRKAGVPEEELTADQPFGPVIFSYTRAQAIEDGVLIDVTPIAKQVGFKIHTAITCGVAAEITDMVRRRRPEDFEKYPLYRVQAAAFRAMLETLYVHVRRQKTPSDRLDFSCDEVSLWAHVGPGYEGEPVLTIMLQGED